MNTYQTIPQDLKRLLTIVMLLSTQHISIAQTPTVSSSKLSRSDIAFSMRFYDYLENNRTTPTSPPVPHVIWSSKAADFYANRMLWMYKRENTKSKPDPQSFYNEATTKGYPFQYAKPFFLPISFEIRYS